MERLSLLLIICFILKGVYTVENDNKEEFKFDAKIESLMKIIVNSLYTEKGVFLRELISNANDAIEKLKYFSLKEGIEIAEPKITVTSDEKHIYIRDNGIGMNKQQLIANLGTIARSGTSDFVDQIKKKGESDPDVIGKFGVGFYSAFLVADTVEVVTKALDDEQIIWESDSTKFSIKYDTKGNTLGQGTLIILHLREGNEEYASPSELKKLAEKYSQFVKFPLFVEEEKTITEKAPEENTNEEDNVASDSDKGKTVEKKVRELVQVNKKPIWTRDPKSISTDEYNEFYKQISKDSGDPLFTIHFKADGPIQFTVLLFIPKSAPQNYYSQFGHGKNLVSLYSNTVFIKDVTEEILPSYFRMMHGVLSGDSVSLNVGRQEVQDKATMATIKRSIIRKTIGVIDNANEEDQLVFWNEYGNGIKDGVIRDDTNRKKLAELLQFRSSAVESTKYRKLSDYVKDIKPGQNKIYYASGHSVEQVSKQPLVQLYSPSYEILYFLDPIDEHLVRQLREHESKSIHDINRKGVEVPESLKEEFKDLETSYETFLKWVTTDKDSKFSSKLESVQIVPKLNGTACVIISTEYGHSSTMERLYLSQAYQRIGGTEMSYIFNEKKMLVMNFDHPIIKKLISLFEVDKLHPSINELLTTCYYGGMVRSGYILIDASELNDHLTKVQMKSLDPEYIHPISNNDKVESMAPEYDLEENTPADSSENSHENENKQDEL